VEEEKKKKQAETDAKREANIKEREAKQKGKPKTGSSKYSKKDVTELNKIFKEYDKDNSGKISLEEFSAALKKKKDDSAPRPGEKSTLAQRKATEGISILDLSEQVFHEMDSDGDGDVTFAELLKLMFRHARPDEINTMLSWVAPEPEPEPEPKPELSAEAQKAIKDIFKLYDKDKSGKLSLNELKKALAKTGIDPDEIKTYFTDYDGNGDGEIDKEEFFKLMESTGAFDDM